MKKIWILLIYSLFLGIIGCEKYDAIDQTNTNVTGTWSGLASDNTGPGTLTFTLTQNGTNVSGSVLIKDSRSGITVNGTVSGTVLQSNFQGQISASYSICKVNINFSASVSSSSMSGTYSGTNSCSGPFGNGQFNLSKIN